MTHQGPKSPEKYRKDLPNWQGDEDWQKKDSQTVGGLLVDIEMRGDEVFDEVDDEDDDNDEEED